MSEAERLLRRLLERVRIATRFEYATRLLEWDQQTKMPRRGAEGRAEIFAAVKTEGFKLFTSDEVGKILKQLAGKEEELDIKKQLLMQRINAIYQRSKSIPPDLFGAFNEARSKAYTIWVEARQKSDFALMKSATLL